MTLYSDLTNANIQTDNHESDLYFPVTEETKEILNKFPLQESNATIFKCAIDGKLWFDVPFAYDPYWIKRGF
jgi:hypothetical protein